MNRTPGKVAVSVIVRDDVLCVRGRSVFCFTMQTERTTELSEEKIYDVIVIGGGAAGLMAAGTAARAGRSVLLLEKMEKSARKVCITGKGRCNLTNICPPEEFLEKVRAGRDFFRPAFRTLDNQALCRFFERQGVKLEVEQGRRVFPRSGKAWDIADALRYWCSDNGVETLLNARVREILTVGNRVYGVTYRNKRGFTRKAEARNVILATGGASYPATGSTGDGYGLAHAVGHTIVEVRPALVPLESGHADRFLLSGLQLRNVQVALLIDGTVADEAFGELQFSRRGVEGATTLRLSRRAVDALIDGKQVALSLDLKPALSPEILRERIHRERESLPPDAFFGELLRKLMPRQLVQPMARGLHIPTSTPLHQLTDQQVDELIDTLKHFLVPISDYRPFEEAIVTAGGVSTEEVDPETLQSKIVRGLYFAGEVLDIDADTGGYNLQIAFSTGFLAGQLKKETIHA